MRSFSVKDSPPSASNSDPASDAWLPAPPLLLPLPWLPMSADERLVPPEPTWCECPDLLAMGCNKIEINVIQCGSSGVGRSGIVFYYAHPHMFRRQQRYSLSLEWALSCSTSTDSYTLAFVNMNVSFYALLILQVESFKTIVAHWCLGNRNVGLRAMYINL